MTLPLTPEIVAAAYDFLRTTKPFCEWNLPEPEDVTFKIVRSNTCNGWHLMDKGHHTIAISRNGVAHTMTLIATVGHEMIHLFLRETGVDKRGRHSKVFYRLAEKVARIHGFDPKNF